MATAPQRPPVTIAVLAREDRRHPKDLFAALSPQLRTGDTVVVLGPQRTSQQLGSWLERRSNGSLERPRTLPRPAKYLLFVDALVTPSNDLINILFEGAAEEVDAVAPRSNFGHGGERWVNVPYGRADIGVKRAFLREIGASRPHRFAPTTILDGPCVLVRRDIALTGAPLDGLGTTRALRDALQQMRDRGARFIVAENAFAHHPHGAVKDDHVLVSAALIVKDEEHQLRACLDAASLLADELVIYDTGSSDGTIALARRAGATVIEGFWDNDFARARNEALRHCRGQWILWVDADEVLECPDPDRVRALLSSSSGNIDAYLVPIDNLQGTEAGTIMTHPAARLFRRATCQWEGRLHEQIVTRITKTLINVGTQDLVRITHRGYLELALRGRDKAQRNLRTALGDLAGGSELDLATRALSLARSYMLAGRYEEGRELCTRVLTLAIRPSTTRLALRALSDALLALGRFDEALEVSDKIKQVTENPLQAYIVEGQARLGRSEPELALAAFDQVVAGRDDDGFEYTPSLIAAPRAKALIALDRRHEAADTLLEVLRAADGIDVHIGNLVQLLQSVGRSVCEILEALRPERQVAFVPQILQLEPADADQVLDAWHGHDPASLPILAAAAQVALRLPADRQLVWSSRLRAAGLSATCPLIVSALDERNQPSRRAIAAAVAFQSFGDERGRRAYRAAALAVTPQEWPTLLEQISALSFTLAEESRALCPTVRSVQAPPTPPDDRRDVLIISTRVADLGAMAFSTHAVALGHLVTLVQPAPWEGVHSLLAPLGVTVRCWEEYGLCNEQAALRATARLYADRSYDAVVLTKDLAPFSDQFQRLVPLASVTTLDDELGARMIDPDRLFGNASTACSINRNGGVVVVDPAGNEPDEPERLARQLDALVPPSLRDEPLAIVGGNPAALRLKFPDAMLLGPVANPGPWLSTAKFLLLLGAEHRRAWQQLATAFHVSLLEVPAPESSPAVAGTRVVHHSHSTNLLAQAAQRPSTNRPSPLSPLDESARLLPTSPRRVTASHLDLDHSNQIQLRGAIHSLDSLAQVNRELVAYLANDVSLNVEVFTPEPPPSGGAASQLRGIRIHHLSGFPTTGALEIRHQWPPDFTPSSARRLALIQPWEFGGFPAEWIGPIRDVVDELWVPTTWVRQCAIASGVDPNKVYVVPNGIDTTQFSPIGDAFPLHTKKSTRFLFVGGCIPRKGVDILLETYLTTFAREDDVCLVVKPYGADGVYRNATLEEDIRRAARGSGAEIEVIDGDLSRDDMARLYRSCTALTHPYRGEGFGLPIAEAMACGLPVIVSDGGACVDFCSESTGWLVASRKVTTSVPEFTPSGPGWWWLEASRQGLATALQAVANDPVAARERGMNGRQRILNGLTVAHAGAIAAERINALLRATDSSALVAS